MPIEIFLILINNLPTYFNEIKQFPVKNTNEIFDIFSTIRLPFYHRIIQENCILSINKKVSQVI